MRVLCLVPYPTLGASNRLRVQQYAPHLRPLGIELDTSPFLDEAAYAVLYQPGHTAEKVGAVIGGLARRLRDLVRSRGYDLVLIHRESAPVGPPIIERILGLAGVRYVYDFDDAIFLAPVHPANQAWSWLRHRSRVAETARRATAVVTGNEYLAAWAREYNSDVRIIPTPVDTDRHVPRAAPASSASVVLGWVGSSTTAPYLRLLDGALTALSRRRLVALRVVGGEYRHESVQVECVPFRLADEPAQIAGFDIGLLPEPDDPWTRGKGAFKALLYMATAVPVVASRVGVNAEVVGEGGICVDDVDGWVDALERLASDPDLRARLGAAGRERAERVYSVAVQAPRLADVLRRAAS